MYDNKEKLKRNFAVFGSLRVMICAALLAALSIIFGKYLKIPIGDVIRISFENTPVIMAGIFFGPVVGLTTGAVADIVGCLLYGYAINPVITLGAAVIGLSAGIMSNYIVSKPLWLKVALSVAVPHILGSVIIKTLGLASWYKMPLIELMGWRALTYLGIGVAEFVVIFLLMRSKAFMKQLEKITEKRNKRKIAVGTETKIITVECKKCGATNTCEAGSAKNCEYCGTPLDTKK